MDQQTDNSRGVETPRSRSPPNPISDSRAGNFLWETPSIQAISRASRSCTNGNPESVAGRSWEQPRSPSAEEGTPERWCFNDGVLLSRKEGHAGGLPGQWRPLETTLVVRRATPTCAHRCRRACEYTHVHRYAHRECARSVPIPSHADGSGRGLTGCSYDFGATQKGTPIPEPTDLRCPLLPWRQRGEVGFAARVRLGVLCTAWARTNFPSEPGNLKTVY